MSDKPHRRMGPQAPLPGEDEYLGKPRPVRFGAKLEEQIHKARGAQSFSVWLRWAARRALGLSTENLADGGKDRDPSGGDPREQ